MNGYAYLSHDAVQGIYIVISVGQGRERRNVDANLIVRPLGEKIIIERDMNDKLLVDALLQAGVPRSQVILAYEGEPVPESA